MDKEIGKDIDIFLGDYIKKLRVSQGLSITKLAKLSGVSQSHFSYIEKGERSISFKLLLQICSALGYAFEEFIKGLNLQGFSIVDESNGSVPEYNRFLHLAKLLDHQELKIVLQVMEKLFENRTNPKSEVMLNEYLELLNKGQ